MREQTLQTVELVQRFQDSNHIDASITLVLRSALLRASRRTATSEIVPAAILRDGASRLLRMRSVGLSSIRPIRLVSWNRSTRQARHAGSAHSLMLVRVTKRSRIF